MRISDWSSDVCSSDLPARRWAPAGRRGASCRPGAPRRPTGVSASGRKNRFRREALGCEPLSVRAELVEAPFFLSAREKEKEDGLSTSPGRTGVAFRCGQIGRASGREEVGPYGCIAVDAVALKKKKN